MTFDIGYPVVWMDGRTYSHVTTNFLGWIDNQFFLAVGPLGRTWRARGALLIFLMNSNYSAIAFNRCYSF